MDLWTGWEEETEEAGGGGDAKQEDFFIRVFEYDDTGSLSIRLSLLHPFTPYPLTS